LRIIPHDNSARNNASSPKIITIDSAKSGKTTDINLPASMEKRSTTDIPMEANMIDIKNAPIFTEKNLLFNNFISQFPIVLNMIISKPENVRFRKLYVTKQIDS
jgi:hypothetical protein